MSVTTISGELCKKIVLHHPSCCDHTKVRIPNETADAIGHVLRMFVVEARARASIEAECDLEGGAGRMDSLVTNDEHGAPSNVVSIRADHITKVAAEMLMDFS